MSISSASIQSWCDLPVGTLTFSLDPSLIASFPPLDLAIRAVSSILSNEHLIENFAAHFIPYEDYKGRLPNVVPSSIMKQMRKTFTVQNLPSIILFDKDNFNLSVFCAVYGCYRGRENESDMEIIYLNKQLLDCSKHNDQPENIIRYGSIILFTILHELGHWCFHHFSCNLDHDLATPKGILMEEAGEAIEILIFGFRIQHYGPQDSNFLIDDIVTKHNDGFRIIPIDYLKSLFKSRTYDGIEDSTSLSIPMKQLKKAKILQEELLKFSCKKVFDPIDEPQLTTAANIIGNPSGKRIFNPCDKIH